MPYINLDIFNSQKKDKDEPSTLRKDRNMMQDVGQDVILRALQEESEIKEQSYLKNYNDNMIERLAVEKFIDFDAIQEADSLNTFGRRPDSPL